MNLVGIAEDAFELAREEFEPLDNDKAELDEFEEQ